MKKLLTIFLILFSIQAFTEDYFPVAQIHFQIAAKDSLDKLEETLKYPESLLNKFKPAGGVITKKRVSKNHISFNMTKSYMFISKTVKVQGVLDSNQDNDHCAKNETGYIIIFNFDGSDSLVNDNFDRIEVNLCVKEKNLNLMTGVVDAKIYKGRNFSNALGPMALGIIEAQVQPLIQALQDEITSQN